MKECTTGNVKVDIMAQIHLTGNVTPQIWYRTITRENGKPHLLAIAILSDIVYWYRPTEIRDEATGQLTGYRKKFKADILQRSYTQFAELFGESKRSVIDAVIRLEALGVIRRVFRTIEVSGMKYNNVLFIDFFPERLYELTYPDKISDNSGPEPELFQSDPATKYCERGHESENTLSQNIVGGATKYCDREHEISWEGPQNSVAHNTKITTETTTEITSSSSNDDAMIQEYLAVANGMYAAETVEAVITELRKHDRRFMKVILPPLFLEICKNITEYATQNIANKSAYIQRCIDNMISGQRLSSANTAYRIRAENQFLQQSYDSADWSELEQKILSN